jgi:hypothetical protein
MISVKPFRVSIETAKVLAMAGCPGDETTTSLTRTRYLEPVQREEITSAP